MKESCYPGDPKLDQHIAGILGSLLCMALALRSTLAEVQAWSVKKIKEECLLSLEDIHVRTVSVDQDRTNRHLLKLDPSDKSETEGSTFFDVYTQVVLPVSGVVEVDVEGQRDMRADTKDYLRTVYYSSRMISSQKGRVFGGSDYHRLRRTISIFVGLTGAAEMENILRIKDEDHFRVLAGKSQEEKYSLPGRFWSRQ